MVRKSWIVLARYCWCRRVTVGSATARRWRTATRLGRRSSGGRPPRRASACCRCAQRIVGGRASTEPLDGPVVACRCRRSAPLHRADGRGDGRGGDRAAPGCRRSRSVGDVDVAQQAWVTARHLPRLRRAHGRRHGVERQDRWTVLRRRLRLRWCARHVLASRADGDLGGMGARRGGLRAVRRRCDDRRSRTGCDHAVLRHRHAVRHEGVGQPVDDRLPQRQIALLVDVQRWLRWDRLRRRLRSHVEPRLLPTGVRLPERRGIRPEEHRRGVIT